MNNKRSFVFETSLEIGFVHPAAEQRKSRIQVLYCGTILPITN